MFEGRKRKSIFSMIWIVILLIIIWYTYGYLTDSPKQKELLEDGLKTNDNETRYPEDKEKGYISMNGDKQGIKPILIETSGEITTSDTILVFEERYSKCGHIKNSYKKVGEDEVGMTQDELAERFPDWKLQWLSDEKVVLRKVINNYCPDHYILKEQDGFVAIFVPAGDTEGLILMDTTGIKVHRLSAVLQKQVKDGISVESLEKVEHLMESWDS